MSVRSSASKFRKELHWRIIRLKKSRAAFMGYVQAPNERLAIERAARDFQVRPELVERAIRAPF